MCESAVDTSNVAEEALEVVVIVVAKIKAVTLVDTDIMAHSLCQVPVANTQLSDSLHTSVVVMVETGKQSRPQRTHKIRR